MNGKQSGTLSPRSMPKVAPDGRGMLRHLEDHVRKRAQRKWRETGNPDGHANWIAAEIELHEEAMQRQANLERLQKIKLLEKEQARLGEELARLRKSQKDVEDDQRKVDKEIEDLKNQIDDHDQLLEENNSQLLERQFATTLQSPEEFSLRKNNSQLLERQFATTLQSPEEFSLRKNNSQLLEEKKKPFRKINDFEDMKKLLQENVYIKGANLVIQDHEIIIKAAEH